MNLKKPESIFDTFDFANSAAGLSCMHISARTEIHPLSEIKPGRGSADYDAGFVEQALKIISLRYTQLADVFT
jgi:hypothetical protein